MGRKQSVIEELDLTQPKPVTVKEPKMAKAPVDMKALKTDRKAAIDLMKSSAKSVSALMKEHMDNGDKAKECRQEMAGFISATAAAIKAHNKLTAAVEKAEAAKA